jgi:GH15 family glucan-1,4-alpha-glucosidase
MVQALAASRRRVEAEELLTQLLELANPFGLLPEEIDPTDFSFLGNFPQALTHAALVQAALALRDAPGR